MEKTIVEGHRRSTPSVSRPRYLGTVTISGDQRQGRRTQAQRRAESEQRLLQAFAELIIEKGVAQTSLTDIGRRAGYSHTLVHHLFGSKAAFLDRLTETVEQFALQMGQDANDENSGAATLLAVARGYLSMVVEDANPLGRVLAVLIGEAVSGTDELRQWRRAWDHKMHGAFADVIRSGIADGSITSHDKPEELAVFAVGMLRGVALELLFDNSLLLPSAQRLITDALEALLRGS
jgi:AcrR family transcriptional regulator